MLLTSKSIKPKPKRNWLLKFEFSKINKHAILKNFTLFSRRKLSRQPNG